MKFAALAITLLLGFTVAGCVSTESSTSEAAPSTVDVAGSYEYSEDVGGLELLADGSYLRMEFGGMTIEGCANVEGFKASTGSWKLDGCEVLFACESDEQDWGLPLDGVRAGWARGALHFSQSGRELVLVKAQ